MKKKWILAATFFTAVIALIINGPIPQDPAYHNFADKRNILGVPNFMNVITNLPFLFIGIAGIAVTLKASQLEKRLKIISIILFMGFILLLFGSSYYHYQPSHFSLVFDRLPILVIIMSLLSIFIYDYFGASAGIKYFYFLNLMGVVSIIYWYHTELLGNGDLRLYIMLQFYPLVAIPLILWLYKAPYNYTGEVICIFIAYGIARITEGLDKEIFSLTGFISGHSLKHIFMAVAGGFIVIMAKNRFNLKKDSSFNNDRNFALIGFMAFLSYIYNYNIIFVAFPILL